MLRAWRSSVVCLLAKVVKICLKDGGKRLHARRTELCLRWCDQPRFYEIARRKPEYHDGKWKKELPYACFVFQMLCQSAWRPISAVCLRFLLKKARKVPATLAACRSLAHNKRILLFSSACGMSSERILLLQQRMWHGLYGGCE